MSTVADERYHALSLKAQTAEITLQIPFKTYDHHAAFWNVVQNRSWIVF